MNGVDILKIAVPELLFSKGIKVVVDKEYKELAKKYHPDVAKDNGDVFAHIHKLYSTAKERIEQGTWEIPGVFIFRDIAGSEHKIRYKYRYPFEFGRMYGGDTILAYFVEKEYHNFYANAKRRIKNLKFINSRMQDEFARCLPEILYEGTTAEHYVLILSKTTDVVPLRGIKELYKSGLDPKQVAWIVSSLHNVTCYLYWAGLAHLNINLDTYFISYKHHTGLLLGGWWYATSIGNTIEHVSKHTYDLMRTKLVLEKKATYPIDTELIKSVGRELMGDYMSKKRYPELVPMIDWLLIPANQDPYKQFESWGEVLTETFGPRKFVELKTNNKEIYSTLQ